MDWRDVITEHYAELLAACQRVTCDRARAEEAMSAVVCHRLPHLLELYDSELGELMPYLARSIHWLVWKWLVAEDRYRKRYPQLECPAEWKDMFKEEVWVDHQFEVVELVRRTCLQLSEYDLGILLLRYVEGMTFEDISERLKISKGSAHGHCARALQRARSINGLTSAND